MGKTTIVDSVTITDNTEEYKKMLDETKKVILEAIGEKAEGYAKDGCPVDTGRLRNSITYATSEHSGFTHSYTDDEGNSFSYNVGKTNDKDSVFIGTNVEYAEWNEFHNSKKPHFLRNAATQHTPEYKEIVKAGLAAAEP